jgi:protease IV
MKRAATCLLMTLALTLAGPAWAQTAPATGAIAPPAAHKAKVGVIRLSSTLTERPESFSLSLSLLTSGGKAPALSDLMASLNMATHDSSLDGVLLDLSDFTLDLNQAQEIGALLTNVRKSGKRVAIYAADYDTPTYVLASYGDSILMPENGEVMIPGVGMQMLFFAGTLEKLHMSADFVQIGKFKGAEEPFTRKSASPEYRAQIEKLVDGMYAQLVSTIAANRPNLTQEQVKKAIDEAWFSGKRAKELGLVDRTIGRDKLEGWVNEQFKAGAVYAVDYGMAKREPVDLSSPLTLLSLLSNTEKPKTTFGPTIAILYATGEIAPDSPTADSTAMITPTAMRKAIRTAVDDPNIRAIVLRVDSPGGSASASDEIWAMLKEADKKKPVTVSMGHMAASGGYYISCAGRRITADPATITGSIGVVGGKVVLKGALDWAGINIEPIDRGQHAEMLSMLRPFTDEERAFVKKTMTEVYDTFTSRVSAARGAKVAQLDEVTQGRLFTGEQAKAVGLVDDVETLNDAVRAAAKSVGLGETYQVIILPQTKTLADILREGVLSDVKAPLIAGDLHVDPVRSAIDALPAELRAPARQALRSLERMQSERVLLEMPPGLVEMHVPHR